MSANCPQPAGFIIVTFS